MATLLDEIGTPFSPALRLVVVPHGAAATRQFGGGWPMTRTLQAPSNGIRRAIAIGEATLILSPAGTAAAAAGVSEGMPVNSHAKRQAAQVGHG